MPTLTWIRKDNVVNHHQEVPYRLLAFWDTDAETLVVATHGFIKKTQKTPRKEINKAEAIRNLYFETKK